MREGLLDEDLLMGEERDKEVDGGKGMRTRRGNQNIGISAGSSERGKVKLTKKCGTSACKYASNRQ